MASQGVPWALPGGLGIAAPKLALLGPGCAHPGAHPGPGPPHGLEVCGGGVGGKVRGSGSREERGSHQELGPGRGNPRWGEAGSPPYTPREFVALWACGYGLGRRGHPAPPMAPGRPWAGDARASVPPPLGAPFAGHPPACPGGPRAPRGSDSVPQKHVRAGTPRAGRAGTCQQPGATALQTRASVAHRPSRVICGLGGAGTAPGPEPGRRRAWAAGAGHPDQGLKTQNRCPVLSGAPTKPSLCARLRRGLPCSYGHGAAGWGPWDLI